MSKSEIMQAEDVVYIPLRTTTLTLGDVLARVERIQAEHPDEEIFLDGDKYAIVGRKRRARKINLLSNFSGGSLWGCACTRFNSRDLSSHSYPARSYQKLYICALQCELQGAPMGSQEKEI